LGEFGFNQKITNSRLRLACDKGRPSTVRSLQRRLKRQSIQYDFAFVKQQRNVIRKPNSLLPEEQNDDSDMTAANQFAHHILREALLLHTGAALLAWGESSGAVLAFKRALQLEDGVLNSNIQIPRPNKEFMGCCCYNSPKAWLLR
jgi:hypothetical protein